MSPRARCPSTPTGSADVDAMAALVDQNTVIVVGSAPQYPQGVIDPIPELAALAGSVGASMHVDACMGGFVLPFMEMNDIELPPWDFRVDGVTTISADIHKLGYAPKGASVLVHRTRNSVATRPSSSTTGSAASTRHPACRARVPGLPMATAWAVMHHLGIDGYRRLTAVTIDCKPRKARGGARNRRLAGARRTERAPSRHHREPAARIRSTPSSRGHDAATRLVHDRQAPPDSLHVTVSAGNAPVIEEYLDDLQACVTA